MTYSGEEENALTVPNYAVLQQFFGYYLSYLSGGVDTQEVATEDFEAGFAMLKKRRFKTSASGTVQRF